MRNHRGGITTGVLFGLGASLTLGIGIDLAIVVLEEGKPIDQLIGQLGLPGAILCLVASFLLGAKAWQALRTPSAAGTGDTAAVERTNDAVREIRDHLDRLEGALAENMNGTRHELRNVLHELQLNILAALERRRR